MLIHVFKFIYMYIYLFVCLFIWISIYVHIYVYLYICICIYVYILQRIHICIYKIHIHIYGILTVAKSPLAINCRSPPPHQCSWSNSSKVTLAPSSCNDFCKSVGSLAKFGPKKQCRTDCYQVSLTYTWGISVKSNELRIMMYYAYGRFFIAKRSTLHFKGSKKGQ